MTRVIDTVTHSYSGKQLLYSMLEAWRESTAQPVIVLAQPNEAEWKINALRVALSKERKARSVPNSYGLVTSERFKWSHERTGTRCEAITVYFKRSDNQKLAVTLSNIFNNAPQALLK